MRSRARRTASTTRSSTSGRTRSPPGSTSGRRTTRTPRTSSTCSSTRGDPSFPQSRSHFAASEAIPIFNHLDKLTGTARLKAYQAADETGHAPLGAMGTADQSDRGGHHLEQNHRVRLSARLRPGSGSPLVEVSSTFDPQARGRPSSGRPRADYGSWESPISVAALAEVGEAWARFDRPEPTSTGTYWLEARPAEGRTVLLYQPLGGTAREVVNGVDVGTEVHEYGGGGYFLDGSTVYFSNRVDGRLYRYADGVDRAPRPISPLPEFPRALRYADGIAIPGGEWVVCVRESHAAEPVRHELVVLAAGGEAEPRALVSDHDFVSSPCVSPDGTQLAWMTWDHPSMPFHATDLWLADLSDDGSIGAPAHVAGGSEESIFQPQWSPEGELYYVSDRTGWWNLYRLREGRHDAACPLAAEVGWPQWWCSLSSYAFLTDGTLACLVNWGSRQELAVIDPEAGTLRQVSLPFTAVARPQLRAHGTRVVFVGASTIEAPTLVAWDPSRDTYEVLARSGEPLPGVGWISRPSSISLARPGEASCGRATPAHESRLRSGGRGAPTARRPRPRRADRSGRPGRPARDPVPHDSRSRRPRRRLRRQHRLRSRGCRPAARPVGGHRHRGLRRRGAAPGREGHGRRP